MNRRRVTVVVGLDVLVIIFVITVAWLTGYFTYPAPEESVFVTLRADMLNAGRPNYLFECNVTWWVNTTRVQSTSQKFGFALVSRSGPHVSFNESHVYLPMDLTDGFLYAVPQVPEGYTLNWQKTIRMNPRVGLVIWTDIDFDGTEDIVLRVWCRPDSFPLYATGHAFLYVTVWISDFT